ncbi:NADH-quinone oxidoreductase subunit G [Pseudohongiella nitratireducens]|uniref:NADH-quinone oxidoreductase subunit G n=2 Tax=Pseudohongiella nitratireducens TaxID=1768907 RepID=A0A916QLJ2_9GAMM|nr:NADH-quinone oxidoreductase subunit G [Pseudohongiella nitratireducens]
MADGMSEKVSITIDNQAIEVDPDKNLLEEVLSAGLDLPYFCWHPSMDSVGSCRQCAMTEYADEEDQHGRLIMACMSSPRDGARYSLQAAADFRAEIIEGMMISHPHDCAVCEEGGECHLQDMTVMSGHTYRRYDGTKVTHRNQNLGPFIGHEMNRCITCYRCVRFYRDYAGGTDLGAQASHHHVYFGRYDDGPLESEFSGNLAEVCPTGVFTDKVFSKHYSRKWDLQTSPSICAGCSIGCNINPGERYGTLRRVVNRYNDEVNGYFICDRGRFGTGYVNDDAVRIRQSMTRSSQDADPVLVSNADALQQLQDMSGAIGIGSPRASMEANFALREKVGKANFYAGLSQQEFAILQQILSIYQDTPAHIASLKDVEASDAVLILGEDLTNTAARMALAVRQSVRHRSFEKAAEQKIPLWHDAAVRKLAMDERSPLYILSPHATRLDDVSETTHICNAGQAARIAAAVASRFDKEVLAPEKLDKAEQALVKRITASFKGARQPLIIAGSNSMSLPLVQSAANLAQALYQKNELTQLALVGSEANGLGLMLLMEDSQQDLQQAFATGTQSAIVVENDLYRRAPTAEVDHFIAGLEQLAVIDNIKTRTGEQAHLVCASATFAESSGTFVNYEGRAQHYYATFKPVDSILPATRWLAPETSLATLTQACSQTLANCAGMADLTPGQDYHYAGLLVPRQQFRYSGRTAMRANKNVHEPKQEQDPDGIMSYSMEGVSPLKEARVFNTPWAPGWNSNQSVFKFQDEVGGHLKQSSIGVRLLDKRNSAEEGGYIALDSSEKNTAFPLYHLFGSEELSAQSQAIQARATSAYVAMNPADADRLGFNAGGGVTVQGNGVVPLLLRDSIATGSVGISVGLPGLNVHDVLPDVSLEPAPQWQAPPQWQPDNIIVSDRLHKLHEQEGD